MNVLAVILARAGSVGLKNKHIASLLGRPVIAYTFEHARTSRRISRTIVSSDCPAVLNLAAGGGFQIIVRPAELATAEASVQSVLLHALSTVEARSGFRADKIVTLYGNVPVRPVGVIDRTIELLESTGCDSVRSFCPVGKWHPAWMARLDHDKVTPLQSGSIDRRQNLEPLFLHDGAVVACTRASLLRGVQYPDDPHAFFGADRRAIETDPAETVEIDRPLDLYLAEAVLRQSHETRPFRAAS